MKLIIYEMKKSWLRLPVFLSLIIFIILNFYKYSSVYSLSAYLPSGDVDIRGGYYKYCTENLLGEITSEKINAVNVIYRNLSSDIKNGNFTAEYDESCMTGYKYGDYTLFSAYIIPELEYAVTYPNTSNRITAEAYENVLFFNEWGNKTDALKNRYIYDLYSGRSIDSFDFTGWAKIYFSYDFSSLLIMIMIIVGLSSSFSAEYENGMSSIIISLNKMSKTVNAKLMSSFIYIFMLTSLFTAANLVTANYFTKIGSLDVPVYYAEFFKYSPFDFSLFDAVVICAGIRLLVFLILGGITQIISYTTKNSIITAAVMFGAVTALIALTSESANIFNPVNVLSTYKFLTKFESVIIFGKPVLMLHFVAISYTLLLIAVICALKIISKSKGRKNNAQI